MAVAAATGTFAGHPSGPGFRAGNRAALLAFTLFLFLLLILSTVGGGARRLCHAGRQLVMPGLLWNMAAVRHVLFTAQYWQGWTAAGGTGESTCLQQATHGASLQHWLEGAVAFLCLLVLPTTRALIF